VKGNSRNTEVKHVLGRTKKSLKMTKGNQEP